MTAGRGGVRVGVDLDDLRQRHALALAGGLEALKFVQSFVVEGAVQPGSWRYTCLENAHAATPKLHWSAVPSAKDANGVLEDSLGLTRSGYPRVRANNPEQP